VTASSPRLIRLSSRIREQSFLREGSAGVRFEISLEFQSLIFLRKRAVPDELPRDIFGRVRRFARVVVCQTLLKICGRAGILVLGGGRTANDIDVPHDDSGPSSLSLRSSYAGHTSPGSLGVAAPRVARQGEAWWAQQKRHGDNYSFSSKPLVKAARQLTNRDTNRLLELEPATAVALISSPSGLPPRAFRECPRLSGAFSAHRRDESL